MAQYWWQPSPDDLGNAPDNFTNRVGSATLTVMQDVIGDYYLSIFFNTNNNRDFVSIDSIDGVDLSNIINTEVYLDCIRTGTDSSAIGVAHRFSGSTNNNWTGYVGQAGSTPGATGTQMRWLRCIDGSNAVIGSIAKATPAGERYGYRSRSVDGDQSIKTWPMSESEPPGFDLTVENTEITQAGRIALYDWSRQESVHIYGIGIGTNGDPAPTEPVGGGVTVDAETESYESQYFDGEAATGVLVSADTYSFEFSYYDASTESGASISAETYLSEFEYYDGDIAQGATVSVETLQAEFAYFDGIPGAGASVDAETYTAEFAYYDGSVIQGATVHVKTELFQSQYYDGTVTVGSAFVRTVKLSGVYRKNVILSGNYRKRIDL